jgi:ankyrin repeat protein
MNIRTACSGSDLVEVRRCLQAGSGMDLVEVRRCLQAGIDVNFRDHNGHTPLHYAVAKNDLELVRELINHQADVNCQDNYGWTALHYASFNGLSTMVEELIRHGDIKFNIQTNDSGKGTVLHCASVTGNLAIVKLLIPYVDRTIQNNHGKTALEVGTNEIKEFISNYQDIPEIKEPEDD